MAALAWVEKSPGPAGGVLYTRHIMFKQPPFLRPAALLLAAILFSHGIAHAQQTNALEANFLEHVGAVGYEGSSFSGPFTFRSTQNVVLRFVSDSSADAMILTAKEVNKLRYGRKAKGYAKLEKRIGTQTAKIPAGTYYLAVRNRSQTMVNNFRCELDLQLNLGKSSRLVDNPLQEATYVQSGAVYTKPFVVKGGFRYFLDGCNLGLDSYVIAESELSKFTNNQSFTALYSSQSANGPGLWELQLEPGNYYLCFDNWNYSSTPVVCTLERWRDAAIKPAISLSGNHSWKVAGSSVELRVGAVRNSSTKSSGFLRLNLWATKDPYGKNEFKGVKVASSVLDPLAVGAAYQNLVRVAPFAKPSAGKYYMTLSLEEYDGTSWVQRDFFEFSGTTKF